MQGVSQTCCIIMWQLPLREHPYPPPEDMLGSFVGWGYHELLVNNKYKTKLGNKTFWSIFTKVDFPILMLKYSRGIGYANLSGWLVINVFLMCRLPTPWAPTKERYCLQYWASWDHQKCFFNF